MFVYRIRRSNENNGEMMKADIVGVNHNRYIDKAVSGYNCNFEYTNSEFESCTIYFIAENNDKFSLKMWMTDGECGSGWCTATFGEYEFKEVTGSFEGINLLPKERMEVDISELCSLNGEKELRLETLDGIHVCKISNDGGDSYYPSGYFEIDERIFNETPRTIKKRRTYIIKGPSGIGKSFLTKSIDDLKVYETDCSDTLPDNIVYDVVVLGNRSGFTVEDITKRLDSELTETVIVDMSFEA